MAAKLSIQGVQPKFSVKLNVKEQSFKVCEKGGTFIIKPQSLTYEKLPENEDLTMKLARAVGIETPWHGLIMCKDESLSYCIKRFDRYGQGKKFSLEDFSQIMGASRDTKYLGSMEKVAEVIDQYSTYMLKDWLQLFKRTIFSFLVGNEDMHLKNFSLITREDRIELSPAYDLLNSTLATPGADEELALSLKDKKRNLELKDFKAFAQDSLFLTEKVIESEIKKQLQKINDWFKLIDMSFLPEDMKTQYKELITHRANRLKL